MDRIDLHVEVPHVPYDELASQDKGEGSDAIRERVIKARNLQLKRFSDSKTHSNACMNEQELQTFCKPDVEADEMLRNAVDALGFSARSYGRILKVSRTIADLEGAEDISAEHVSEAIQYRTLDRDKKM